MMIRNWFYVAYMFFLVVLIYLVEMWVGNVYARYVLAYTGIIFIAGMRIGQRSEQGWILRQEGALEKGVPETGKNVQGGYR